MRTRRDALLGSMVLLSTIGCGWAFHLNQNPHVPANTPQILRLTAGETTYIRVLNTGVLSASPNLEISCALPALAESCKVANTPDAGTPDAGTPDADKPDTKKETFDGGTSFLVVEKGALVIVKAKEDTSQPRIASLCLHDKPWIGSKYAKLSSSTCVDPLKLVDIYIAPKNAGATPQKK